MIVAPQPAAVEAGAEVLNQGGNAFDAAVTCALVQGVVHPQMSGIGGYLLLNAHKIDSEADSLSLVIDAPALAGSKVRPEMWVDQLIRPNPNGWGYFIKNRINTVGYQSICTPGTVRGLAEILHRWGTISWQKATEAAARIAEEGYTVDSYTAAGWKEKAAFPEAVSLLDTIRSNGESSRIYLKPGGELYEEGEILKNPDYARTLQELGERGAEDFYSGSLARMISDDLGIQGGFVTAADLHGYAVRHQSSISTDFNGYEVATVSAPHGGPTLLCILNILEGYDLQKLRHNSAEYIYLVSMAMKAAFADRNPHLGDPQFVDAPTAWMISKQRAGQWREKIDNHSPILVCFTPPEAPHTTHLSVVDRSGNCVSLTHSLGSSSGVITPGLGFMYNNSMVNFHPLPGHPNSIAAGKGRTTGMTPTIVYRNKKPFLVIGAPGATMIVTSIVQVILNMLVFGMSVAEAVLAPRFDCQGELIKCQARIPERVCQQIRDLHPVVRIPKSHGGFGLVHAIHIDQESGRLRGAADAGSGGMALEAN